MKRWLNLRGILILGMVVMAFGAMIARWETERYRENEYAEFSTQSIQLATVFSRGAGAWLMRGNDAALEFATNLMLAGSVQYVRIVVGNETVLDERETGHEIEALDLTLDFEPSELGGAYGSLRSGGLDVIVPIAFSDQGNKAIGVVQIGFSDTHAREKVRSHRIFIFGLTVGSWLILMLAAISAVRILSMRSHLVDVDSHPDGIIRCGALEIDTEACIVRLSKKDIELTPKMFELLAFLARNEGKTYSDADLLTALWADAPYAASGDVKQCIYMLRRRLKTGHPDPKGIIVNVKGFGYKLESPTEEALSPN